MEIQSILNESLHLEKIEEDRQLFWSIDDSKRLYNIQGWGKPYFSINTAGHITVSPQSDRVSDYRRSRVSDYRRSRVSDYRRSRGKTLDLFELVTSLAERNIKTPLLIRFPDILQNRIERLNNCFANAIAHHNYPGTYQGVFPIKCNQHHHVVKDLVQFGKNYELGLEVGSKPELMIAIAMLENTPDKSNNNSKALLICNGYKDRQYIETALLASKLGQKTIIVIERLEELSLAIALSRNLGIEPVLGVRVKLSTRGTGRWGNSTGEGSKFGLTIAEILEVIGQLQAANMLSCLKLLHFHLGSQISAIAVIKDAIREASQIYVQLVKLGAAMSYLDVGGGLAIDYDGSGTNSSTSKNYNMQNYANDIVATVQKICEEGDVKAPVLVSETGRAIAAQQSVLVFDVLSSRKIETQPPQFVEGKQHSIIGNLWKTYKSISKDNYQKAYRDAISFKDKAISLFSFGELSLTERATAEQLYWACCGKIWEMIRHQEEIPDNLQDLAKIMASIYQVNLSIFQSAPDSWAINQLFPIMPIHRLDEEPQERAILADLTCDSDGKIDQFIDQYKVKDVLELHSLQSNSELNHDSYYLGMFLVGAYQEIMGNMHNLFGSTNVVHVQMTTNGYKIKHVVKGDTVEEIFGYLQYDGSDLIENLRIRTEQALAKNLITPQEAQLLLQNYECSLHSYTYLVS